MALAVLLAAASPCSSGAPADSVTFYLQLVRGTDQEKPGQASWKPVEAKLKSRLAAIFRWNHYWEIRQQKVTVQIGGSSRTRMSRDREAEIKLLDRNQAEIKHYRKGKLTRESRESVDRLLSITGGDKEAGEAWFVVVRTDEPGKR